jgi:hypothetical protein
MTRAMMNLREAEGEAAEEEVVEAAGAAGAAAEVGVEVDRPRRVLYKNLQLRCGA